MAFSQYFATQVLSWVKVPRSRLRSRMSTFHCTLLTQGPLLQRDTANSITRLHQPHNNFQQRAWSGRCIWRWLQSQIQAWFSSLPLQNTNAVTVTHFGVWDQASGGNFLASGQLTSSVDVELGDTVQFNIGAMAVRVV